MDDKLKSWWLIVCAGGGAGWAITNLFFTDNDLSIFDDNDGVPFEDNI